MQIPLGPASSVGFRDRRPGARSGGIAREVFDERLDAANDNNTSTQIALTWQVWRPRIGRDLTDQDARQIMHNVTGVFGVLAEWARAEKIAAAANDNASPKKGEV
jgi:hypothetical protein